MQYSYIDEPDALVHYGVLGMKWGVRKDGKPQGYQGDGQGRLRQLKTERNQARKTYNKSFNRAYYYNKAHPIAAFRDNSPKNKEMTKRWKQAIDDAENYKAAKTAYKNEKKAQGKTISQQLKAPGINKTKVIAGVGVAALGVAVGVYGGKKLSSAWKTSQMSKGASKQRTISAIDAAKEFNILQGSPFPDASGWGWSRVDKNLSKAPRAVSPYLLNEPSIGRKDVPKAEARRRAKNLQSYYTNRGSLLSDKDVERAADLYMKNRNKSSKSKRNRWGTLYIGEGAFD